MGGLLLAAAVLSSGCTEAHARSPAARRARLLFHGHDSSVGHMTRWEDELDVSLASLDLDVPADEQLVVPESDLVVFLWGSARRGRGAAATDASRLGEALDALLARTPTPPIVTTSRVERDLLAARPDLAERARLVVDDRVSDYLDVGVDRSNLRRLLVYLGVTYLGRDGEVEPPLDDVGATGLFHPDVERPFADVASYLAAAPDPDAPRVVVLAVAHHFAIRNRAAIEALMRALEERGLSAVTHLAAQGDPAHDVVAALAPDVVLDARHVIPADEDRAAFDAPVLQCATLTRLSLEEWEDDEVMSGRPLMGLENSELVGNIEPRVFNGARSEHGPDRFVPIDERVERIADRAAAWSRLRRTPPRDRRVALYAGFGGGTPDNQQLDVARSVLALLERLRDEGYTVGELPDADTLVDRWEARAWDGTPAGLDALARSGHAQLVDVDTYREWYLRRVPGAARAQLEERFGPAPGAWGVWRDDGGRAHFPVPTLSFGHVTLVGSLGLPAGDETIDAIRARMDEHRGLVPSHSLLVGRMLPEEALDAHAIVRFGSFDGALLMPRRVVGLGADDWPEVIAGTLPEIRPFSLAAITFAVPARRRAGALVLGHIPAPSSRAGLDPTVADLRDDVVKWRQLEDGALRTRFAATITDRVRAEGLDRDLGLTLGPDDVLDADALAALELLIVELDVEVVTTAAHVLGAPPDERDLVTQLVVSAGRAFVDGLAAHAGDARGERSPERHAEEFVAAMIRGGLSADEALAANGLDADVPDAVAAGLAAIDAMRAGYARTHLELDNLVRALDGRFVEPGPAGTPERNPDALPSGRSLFFFDPEQIPSDASWTLGAELVDELLAHRVARDGRYPRRVAVSLSTKRTMGDFGVSEAQVLALLGVRPVRSRGRVRDVELIPSSELGRPRIDVFLETKHSYNDVLESRAQLLDRAVRLVCDLDEPGNFVFENRRRAREELRASGVGAERAEVLSRARIFAVPPGHFGSGLHDGLLGDTGVWDTRADLAEVYMAQHDHVFTEGAWGEKASLAYRAQLADAEVVLRTTLNHSMLTGRGHTSGASLANAIEVLSGNRPDYLVADLRRPGEETIASAEELLRRDLRATLFNGTWIAAMMDEGRSGARRVAGMTSKLLAWETHRPDSVDDADFDLLVDVYLRDRKGLRLDEFFEREAPIAMQVITRTLLESARKGLWSTDPATLFDVARRHADSVVRHGHRVDANARLEAFVGEVLARHGARAVSDAYRARLDGPAPAADAAPTTADVDDAPSAPLAAEAPPLVRGTELVPSPAPPPDAPSGAVGAPLALGGLALLAALGAYGALRRRGAA